VNSELPLVSIVTPSFQQGEFIEDTVLSIKGQTYPNIEHIIIDGGSTDGTIEILKRYEDSYRMSWISEPDNGQADAINKGFARATGQIVCWLNSDDIYFDERAVQQVVAEFDRTEADVVYGNDALIGRHGEILRIRLLPKFNYNRLVRYGGISQPAVLFRRSVIEHYRLREDLTYALDTEFWLRISKSHKFKHVGRVLAGNRVHAQRKTIAYKSEARSERLKVAVTYGLRRQRWSRLQSLLLDKPLTMVLRFRGLWHLCVSRKHASRFFPFIQPPGSLAGALKDQLFSRF
jgi:glycosyltransferase involved in cell wall biosynthesis